MYVFAGRSCWLVVGLLLVVDSTVESTTRRRPSYSTVRSACCIGVLYVAPAASVLYGGFLGSKVILDELFNATSRPPACAPTQRAGVRRRKSIEKTKGTIRSTNIPCRVKENFSNAFHLLRRRSTAVLRCGGSNVDVGNLGHHGR